MEKEHPHILIVPDSFKDTATSVEVTESIVEAIHDNYPAAQTTGIPMADGGEGSLVALHAALGGEWHSLLVQDPLGRPLEAKYLLVGKTAYVELAEASGLQLLTPEDRSAKDTSTLGTGLLMSHALSHGAEHIVLCIGGSATNDGGTGIAHALGWRFMHSNGADFIPTGKSLSEITDFSWTGDKKPSITVLCDVNNPFTGPNGAVHIYGPQKGADREDLAMLERGMQHLGRLVQEKCGIDLDGIPGAGAAGGVGGGMRSFFDATLISGIDYLIDALDLANRCAEADVIITGEGKIDAQSGKGKLISGIVQMAAKHKKPVIALCGALEIDQHDIEALGLAAAFSIQQRVSDWDDAVKDTKQNIRLTTHQIVNLLRL
ncbi:MAG: glycerate kinase [Saprospiraceae bacterium]|nr:glycerate kinase [Saprospiraceae bacterium]